MMISWAIAGRSRIVRAARAGPRWGPLDEFVRQHKRGWQKEPRQKPWRCVAHLVSYLVRVVEGLAQGAADFSADMKLTAGEVKSFEKNRKAGRTIGQLKNAATMLDGFHAAQSILRHKLLHALKKVDVFSVLSRHQLEQLHDAMLGACKSAA